MRRSSTAAAIVLEVDAQWEPKSSLIMSRDFFAMTVLRDTVYVVGGHSTINGGYQDSVESYTEAEGWKLEPQMQMPTGNMVIVLWLLMKDTLLSSAVTTGTAL